MPNWLVRRSYTVVFIFRYVCTVNSHRVPSSCWKWVEPIAQRDPRNHSCNRYGGATRFNVLTALILADKSATRVLSERIILLWEVLEIWIHFGKRFGIISLFEKCKKNNYVDIPRPFPISMISMILRYVVKVIILSNVLKVLVGAHCLLRSYWQNKFDGSAWISNFSRKTRSILYVFLLSMWNEIYYRTVPHGFTTLYTKRDPLRTSPCFQCQMKSIIV